MSIFSMISLKLTNTLNDSLVPFSRRVEASPKTIYLKHYGAQIASRTLPIFELVILLPLQNTLTNRLFCNIVGGAGFLKSKHSRRE